MSHAEGLFETFFQQHSINKSLKSSSKNTSSDDDKKLRGKSENSKNIPVNVIVIKVTVSFELAINSYPFIFSFDYQSVNKGSSPRL